MIMAGVMFVVGCLVISETHEPTLLKWKASRLRRETGNMAFESMMDEDPVHLKFLFVKYGEDSHKCPTSKTLLIVHLSLLGLKPSRMMIQEPILIIMTLYMSLVYGILYLGFFSYPISFQFDRGIEFGISSLPFLALLTGVLTACAFMIWETPVIYRPKFISKGRIPEERLIPMMIGSFVLVMGLFWVSLMAGIPFAETQANLTNHFRSSPGRLSRPSLLGQRS